MLQTLELAQQPVELLARRLCNKVAWLSYGNLMAYCEFESALSASRHPNAPAQQPATV